MDANQAGRSVRTDEEIAQMVKHLPEGWRPYRKRVTKLEALSEEMRAEVLRMAGQSSCEEISRWLRHWEVEASPSTVARFLQGERQRAALEARAETVKKAEEFAREPRTEVFREGTLQALRQRMFEVASNPANVKEGVRLYSALIAEEEKLRRLEMDRERLAMQREALELQRQRLHFDAARGGGRVFMEALRILRDEQLEDRVKIERALEQMQSWKAGAIAVGGGGSSVGGAKCGNGELQISDLKSQIAEQEGAADSLEDGDGCGKGELEIADLKLDIGERKEEAAVLEEGASDAPVNGNGEFEISDLKSQIAEQEGAALHATRDDALGLGPLSAVDGES